MSATAIVTEAPLHISSAALASVRTRRMTQVLNLLDPETFASDEDEESALEKLASLNERSQTHKRTPNNVKDTPRKVDSEEAASSPEPEDKRKTPRKAGGREPPTLFDLLGNANTRTPRKYTKANKTPKKRVTKYSDDESEPESASELVEKLPPGEDKWFEGDVAPGKLDINALVVPNGRLFIRSYKILRRLSVDETKGVTYIAVKNKYEVVLRINYIQKDDMEQINTEAKFLEKMELNDAQHFFSTFFDMGVVNKSKFDGIAFYSYIYRGGPTLDQCLTGCGGTFTEGTLHRIAAQMVKILEQVCGQGYRILSFSLKDFTIDARSRVVFLSNYTNIIKAAPGNLVRNIVNPNPKRRFGWNGEEDYAPLSWHQANRDHFMDEMDTMESLLYMLIRMSCGVLPWSGQMNMAKWKVSHADEEDDTSLINFLPPSLKCLWSVIRSMDEKRNNRVNFDFVYSLFAKCTNEAQDFLFDWETDRAATEEQQSVINSRYEMEDMRRRLGAMRCVIDNAEQLAKRKKKMAEERGGIDIDLINELLLDNDDN